jgi:PST family polysaccharide transporter
MSVVRPVTWSAVALLQAEQRTRLIMYLSIVRAVIVLSFIALFGWLGGPLIACAAACTGFAIVSVINITVSGRVAGFSARAYLTQVARPPLACVPMYLAVSAVGKVIDAAGVHGVLSLVVQVVIGAAVYAAMAFVVARPLARDLVVLVRQALRRERPQS